MRIGFSGYREGVYFGFAGTLGQSDVVGAARNRNVSSGAAGALSPASGEMRFGGKSITHRRRLPALDLGRRELE